MSKTAGKKKKELYQTVTLVFADGTKCTYTGRAQIPKNMRLKWIVDILISEPKALPEGYSFSDITKE